MTENWPRKSTGWRDAHKWLHHCAVIGIVLLFCHLIECDRYSKNDVINCDAVYSITEELNGTIQTLDYPKPYPKRRRCNVELHGDDKHRIILNFEDFYLHHPFGQHHQKHGRCSGLDTLSIYDGIGDGAKLLGEFCGGHQPLPLMSSGPNMSLQLTSHTSGVEARGYSAKYYFVQNFGINSGIQKKKGVCEFEYESDLKKSGNITSPNPGGIYPTNTNCTYIFAGTFLERVFLKFHFFDLEGIEPCTARSGSDFVEFQNLQSQETCPARRCGRFTPQEVVSDGPDFRVTFHSNDRLNGLGFAATYKFVTDEQLPEWANYLKNHQGESVRGGTMWSNLGGASLLLFTWHQLLFRFGE